MAWVEAVLHGLPELKVLKDDQLALLRARNHLVVVEPAVVRELPVLLDTLGLRELLQTALLHAPDLPVAGP